MFRLIKSSVSARRIENDDDGDASIYKVSSSGLQVKACVPQTKTKTMSMLDYTELPLASAPSTPWYYTLYPIEVITKSETLLVKTWRYLSVEHQKFFLDIYLNHYKNNILE